MAQPRPDLGGFFGRDRDIARVSELLAVDGKTVTLVGPPGVGKTRLATELARASTSDTMFCDLSEAVTADDVAALLAESLGVAADPSAGKLLDRVCDALAERSEELLVLDNLEQLVEVARPLFAQLRAAVPAIRWLATSRQPLAIAGEWVHEVQPLDLVTADGGDSDALRMLTDRVHRARGTAMPDSERAILDRIAVQLDGLPLALELAAARIASLGATIVESKLTQQLAVLTRGAHAQRTLREAIAWSWNLLAARERAALSQLALFRGGFDIEAAEAVLDGDALDLVDALRHRSLLHIRDDDGGGVRFGLYMSIREFADGEFAADERARRERKHAEYFADLVERERALARLARERDNLASATDRMLGDGSASALAIAGRLLVGFAPLTDRTPIEPYLDRLDRFLTAAAAAGDAVAPRLRVKVQAATARCLRRLGRVSEARRLYSDALTVAHTIGDHPSEALMRSDLGMVAFFEHRIDEALAHFRASAELYSGLGDHVNIAYARVREGLALRESGELARAKQCQLAALDALHAHPSDTFAILALCELAHVHLELGELDDSARLLAEAQARSQSFLGDAAVVVRRGFFHLCRGELEQAAADTARAQVFFRRVGFRRFEAGSRGYAGVVDLMRGDLASARRAFESAYALLRDDRRGSHLSGAWLAYAHFLEGDRDRARHRFESLVALDPGDSFATMAQILALPLQGGAGDLRAAARALAATIDPRTQRTADRSSLDVRLAIAAIERLATSPDQTAAEQVERAPHDEVGEPASGLRVQADGAAFELGADRVSLARHRTLRRILLALVEHRLSTPGDGLSWERVFSIGWPNDRAHSEAARNRVKVAISTLRTLGLRDVVQHDGTGYLLDPTTPVRVIGTELAT